MDFAYPARARDVCLWTGAGISADPPADLPLGDTLTREAIRTLCGSHVRDAFEDEFRRAAMEDNSGRRKAMPRLEGVLEHTFRVAGNDALRPLEVLETGSYNDLHLALAEHLARGGAHITVNLDPCIENAARRPRSWDRGADPCAWIDQSRGSRRARREVRAARIRTWCGAPTRGPVRISKSGSARVRGLQRA